MILLCSGSIRAGIDLVHDPETEYHMKYENDDLISDLYQQLIHSWNKQNAKVFASLFAAEAICIGFDGSQLIGRKEIESALTQIFQDHPTASYLYIIREVKPVAEKVYLLHSNVGMVPPGKTDIDPSKNAVQCMIARNQNDKLEIMLFQNTPAQFHGRPELTEALNKELRALL
jgi:uncharacterized protein (TIGR02246 family)